MISPKRSRWASDLALTAAKPSPVTNSDTSTRRVDRRGSTSGIRTKGGVREGGGTRALVLSLDLVVQLLADAVAQLAGDGLHVEARGEALDQREEDVEVAQVRLDGLSDAGVLHLHGDVAPVVGPRAVDLAD